MFGLSDAHAGIDVYATVNIQIGKSKYIRLIRTRYNFVIRNKHVCRKMLVYEFFGFLVIEKGVFAVYIDVSDGVDSVEHVFRNGSGFVRLHDI